MLTILTSSKGSFALRIRIDSSIFLTWSGVYFTTTTQKKKYAHVHISKIQIKKKKKKKKKIYLPLLRSLLE
jgi:hypothetical protein